MKKIVCICTAVVLLLSMQLCAWAEMKLPEQSEEYYVADYANVLPQVTKDHIVDENQWLHRDSGAQVVVVTVQSLEGNDINAYANALLDQWHVGSTEHDNGALLLLAIEDNAYTLVRGEGLKESLSDKTITKILNKSLKEDFEGKSYGNGAVKAFNQVYEIVRKQYTTTHEFFGGYVWLMVLVTSVVSVVLGFVFYAHYPTITGFFGRLFGRGRKKP